MPRLTPTDLELTKALVKSAEGEIVANVSGGQLSRELASKLEEHKVTLDDALSSLGQIMKYGSKEDNVKLSATKLALQLNKVLDEDGKNDVQEKPVINFIFKDSNVNLNGVFNPTR